MNRLRGCGAEKRPNLHVVGGVCARVPSFPIMVEIRNGGPLWQMWTREESKSALSVTRVARTAGAGSVKAVTPATAMVRAGLAGTGPVAAKAGPGVGVRAVVETVSVEMMEDAVAVKAGTAAAEKVADAMGTAAGAVVVCATTDPTRAV